MAARLQVLSRFGRRLVAGRSTLIAGSALAWLAQPSEPRSLASLARCDASTATTAELLEPPPPPPQIDDPEENAKVLDRWRARIKEARELWGKLDVAGAEAVLKLAIEDAAHFGSSSAPMATSFLNLAQLYRRAGRSAEAEPLLARAVHVLEQNAGPNNKVTLLALLDLAASQQEIGKTAEAAEGFDDVLDRLTIAEENQKHGREAIRDVRAGCLLRAAKAQAELGKLERAEAHLREAIELTEERWGASSSRLTAPYSELAQVLLRQRRAKEAGEMCERALSVSKKQAQRDELANLQMKIAHAS